MRAACSLPRRLSRASVLVIVMITLLFAAFALVAFIEKAGNDLLVEHREMQARRLRMEGYSALEVTLATLEDFRQVLNGLHSPAEGWGDPLAFAGYTPSEDRTVEVTFDDESSKLSLPNTNAQVLARLFEVWQVPKPEAESAADALMGWMKRDHVYTTAISPNYDHGSVPYEVPGRSLRTFDELAAIEKVRDIFYTDDGRANDLWRRFVDNVSLLNFAKPNLNAAKPDVLLALGQFDLSQQQNITDYLSGEGMFQSSGPGYFKSLNDAQTVTGSAGGNSGAFATTISALRVNILVREGRSEFRLAAVVTTGNAASPVQTTATSTRPKTSSSPTTTPTPNAAGTTANGANAAGNATGTAAGANSKNLNYPFTLLEIKENDEIPPLPPPPPAPN